jgi:hypothetical protein
MSDEVARGTTERPQFPWGFLAEPEGPDAELAAIWIFLQLGGKAYENFLDSGPGVLIGPFLSDEEDFPLTTDEALRRHANNQPVGIAVAYIPVLSSQFPQMVPVKSVRKTICRSLDGYIPRVSALCCCDTMTRQSPSASSEIKKGRMARGRPTTGSFSISPFPTGGQISSPSPRILCRN